MNLFLECHNDEAVVRALGVPARLIVHRDGKSRVAKALAKAPAGSMGMIDEDPHDSARVPGFDPFVMQQRHPSFDVLRHSKEDKILVRIRPRLEEWLLDAAKIAQVDLTRFSLPTTASQLHLLKKEKGDRIQKLIEHLLKANCLPIVALRSIIQSRFKL